MDTLARDKKPSPSTVVEEGELNSMVAHNKNARCLSIARLWPLWMAAALLFCGLSYAPFWNPDEGRYSSTSLEMAGLLPGSVSDWITPHLNTIPRLNKPPLVYWAAGSLFRVLGPSEWAGRLVPAVAALGVLLILWQLAGRAFGRQSGVFAALIWATSLLPWAVGRTLNTDMLLTFGITLSLWGLWSLLEPDAAARPWRAALSCGVGLGVALLAKGPVGVALPLGIVFVWRLVALGGRGAFRGIPWGLLTASLALAALLSFPWYMMAESQHPGFLKHFLVGENVKRFAGAAGNDHDALPFWYYLPVVLFCLMPWTGFLPVFGRTKIESTKETASPLVARTRLFCFLWAGLIIGFFSLSSTKLISYVLPAFPALSLLMGEALSHRDSLSLRRLTLTLNLALNVIVLVAASVTLLNDKLIPHTVGLPLVAALMVVLVAGSIGLVWASRRSLIQMVLVQGVFATALYGVIIGGTNRVAPYRDPSPLFRQLKAELRPDDRVVQFNVFVPTAIFYLARPIEFYSFHNSSGLDENALKNSPFFTKYQGKSTVADLATMLADPRRTFVLEKRGKHTLAMPSGVYIWARNSEYQLLCNRPAPPGWQWEFVAPTRQGR